MRDIREGLQSSSVSDLMATLNEGVDTALSTVKETLGSLTS